MQALVTGGSGFIGSEVIRQLISRNIKVKALLRKTSSLANLDGVSIETAYGDITDFESLKRAVAGVDYVFHLAGTVAALNRESYFKHNAEGTGQLARACAEVNPSLKRFLYVSSLAASGPAHQLKPKTEQDDDVPVSNYGESKLAGEKVLFEVASDAGFPVTVVRPPAVYGPRDKGIFEFIKMVNSGILPVFQGSNASGNNPYRQKFYSVIHVEDLVNGIVEMGLNARQGEREVFYLAGDGVFSWVEMMSAIADALKKRPLRIPMPSFFIRSLASLYTVLGKLLNRQFPLTHDKLKELEPDFWICSNEKAKKQLGFTPRWSLKDGMRHTIEWYKLNKWL